MRKRMDEKHYKGFREILWDYGGFDPVKVVNAHGAKEHEFLLSKFKRLASYENKHGSAYDLMQKPKNIDDWKEYYEFYHATLSHEEWKMVSNLRN